MITRREFLSLSLSAAVAAAIAPSLDALALPVEPYNPSDYPWTNPANVSVTFTHPLRIGEWNHVAFHVERSRLVRLQINGVDYSTDPRALTYIQRWLAHPAVATDPDLFAEEADDRATASFRIEVLTADSPLPATGTQTWIFDNGLRYRP